MTAFNARESDLDSEAGELQLPVGGHVTRQANWLGLKAKIMAYIRDIHLPTRRPPVTIRGENVLQIESHATIDQPPTPLPMRLVPHRRNRKKRK